MYFLHFTYHETREIYEKNIASEHEIFVYFVCFVVSNIRERTFVE